MTDLLRQLAKIIEDGCPGDGLFASALPGVHCIKLSAPNHRVKQRGHAALAIVAQGVKEVVLGREVYRCKGGHYIAAPIDLPVTGSVLSATAEQPFLCLKIDFDPLILSEVAAQIEKGSPRETENPLQAMFPGKASDAMLEAAIRLGKLCRNPEDAPALGPLVSKEIFYHLLKGVDGPAIRQFVCAGSKTHQISQAICRLKSELTEEVDVAALAKAAMMSRSAFFKHFKEVAAMSPIQYQKRLRLLEARRLMTEAGETAEGAAYKVGYRSASQFSREYSRMFGEAPLRNVMTIKKTGQSIQSM